MRPDKIIEIARRRRIDKFFVTDHNETRVAKQMQEKYPDRVMVGEEILTTQGELLAFFVSKRIPRGLEPEEAIELLKTQGSFISVPHPYDHQRNGWNENELLKILPDLDALEIFNSRCLSSKMNGSAAALAKEKHLPGTVGSDAHTYIEIGTSVVHLPDFQDADGLRKSLESATYETRLSPPWVHFSSRWAAYVKRLGFAGNDNSMVDG